eukprot:364752-Chlamydomonas_euryale.AAC.2
MDDEWVNGGASGWGGSELERCGFWGAMALSRCAPLPKSGRQGVAMRIAAHCGAARTSIRSTRNRDLKSRVEIAG